MIHRRLFTTLALAGSMALALHTTAQAADAAGDWNGTLKAPAGELRLVIHVQKNGDGSYRAQLDSPDQGAAGISVDFVTEEGGTFKFGLAQLQASYEGKWDATTKTWIGTFSQLGRALPLSLAQGTVAAPAALFIKGIGSDLDGVWRGTLELPTTSLTLALHIATTPDGTSATMDVIEQHVQGVRVTAINRAGPNLKFEMKSLGATFEASLTEDKKTLSGGFSQAGVGPFPLALKVSGS